MRVIDLHLFREVEAVIFWGFPVNHLNRWVRLFAINKLGHSNAVGHGVIEFFIGGFQPCVHRRGGERLNDFIDASI